METLREFIGILGALAQAQSSLCLLGSSWMFTIAWVFATERRKGSESQLGRALLGLFWLPGLLVYYLLPDVQPEADRSIAPQLRKTPKTRLAPHDETPGPERTTRDRAAGTSRRAARRSTDDRVTRERGARHTSSRELETVQRHTGGYHLRVLNGKLKGETFALDPVGSLRIGSGSGNDLRITDDGEVVQRHAAVKGENGRYILRDSSTAEVHTTLVNDIRVDLAQLSKGDIVQVGRTRLKFERAH